jgi:mRNA interferase RelE/StbE
MEIVYLRSFYTDLKKIKDENLKKKIKAFILEVKEAENIHQIKSIKKLKGYAVAYRARFGDYRLGLYKESDDTLEFARLVKRSDIYKLFP